MKVCFIASHLFLGGFTSSMISMIHALQKQGADVSVLFLEPDKNELSTDCLNGTAVIPFPLVGLKKNQIVSYIQVKLLRLQIKHLDHLQENGNFADKRTLEVKRVQLELLRYVKTYMRKMDLLEYDAVISWEELTCNYFLAFQVRAKNKIGYVHPDYLKAKFDSSIDSKAFKKLNFINSVSESTCQTMKLVFPDIQNKMHYVPNVLNVEKIRKESMGEDTCYSNEKLQIVTVCRLDNHSKALDRLVRIADRLNIEGYNFDWHIVGDGNDRSIVEKGKIANVILEGRKDNPYPYVRSADLFVLQSYYEGRPIVVDEAIILGVPVLVTDYQSAIEQVSSLHGFVVDNDEESIFKKIKELLDNPQILKEMKKNMEKESCSCYSDTSALLKEIEKPA